jgi:hypothetical protein
MGALCEELHAFLLTSRVGFAKYILEQKMFKKSSEKNEAFIV